MASQSSHGTVGKPNAPWKGADVPWDDWHVLRGAFLRVPKFTLTEWLVMLGIVTVLVALLLPGPDYDRTHRFPPATKSAIAAVTYAGEYRRAYARHGVLSLRILPDGRYSYIRESMGVNARESGHARNISGLVVLSSTSATESRLPRVFVPVRWGSRNYLVPPEKMTAFCDEVVKGDEPRPGLWGHFLLDDTTSRVTGVPSLPPEWVTYLDKHILLGNVVAMVDDNTARLDVGSDQGVCVGDRLAVQCQGRDGTRLVVVTVEHDSCLARPSEAREGEERLIVGRTVVGARGK